jgi:hypothetical protein
MGGQACILYGAAEFSRDLDLSINISTENLILLIKALKQLDAELIFVPDLDPEALNRGHACHFRCLAPEAKGLRIDLMARMRDCPDFEELWKNRTIVSLPEIGEIGLLSLPDLVQSKKTQREKDWPMIRRLIETDIIQSQDHASEKQILFWLKECRTSSLLIDLARKYAEQCKALTIQRPLLSFALRGDIATLEDHLHLEEETEKEKDRQYWEPLKKELEKWRRGK